MKKYWIKDLDKNQVIHAPTEEIANEYPKVMEVCDDGNGWRKRVVFMKKNDKFLAWVSAESLEEAERENKACTWEFAREIQPVTLELTIDQIAEKFNASPEQIKIKK
jgi:hypothetical protein